MLLQGDFLVLQFPVLERTFSLRKVLSGKHLNIYGHIIMSVNKHFKLWVNNKTERLRN
jgi:hypothetical protein